MEHIKRRAAIFGMGGFARLHHQSLRELEAQRLARLVATCDPNPEAFPNALADLKARGVAVYRDYQTLLEHHADELDWVCIPTPLPFHAPMHRACVERELAVYLEKPPTLDPRELEMMIEVEKSAPFASQVGFNFVGEGARLQLKARMQSGEFGTLRRVGFVAHWPRPTSYYARGAWAGRLRAGDSWVLDSVVGNALAHYVHNLLFWCGRDGLSSWGEVETLEAELYRAHAIESFDSVWARGTCGGAQIALAATHAGSGASWQREWLQCERATIFYLARGGGWEVRWHDGRRESGPTEALSTGEILTRNLRHYLAYLSGDEARPLTTLADSQPLVHLNALLLVAAGHIASVPDAFVERTADATGQEFLAIENVEKHLESFASDGRLPCENALPWARAGGRAVAADIKKLDATLKVLMTE